MREIKFRAWHEYSKGFIAQPKWEACYNSENILLLQYTGLKDKNGMEIYEGDVMAEYKGESYEYYSVVVWDEGTAGFVSDPLCGDGHGRLIKEYAEYSMEVIGNIHENPELLEDVD